MHPPHSGVETVMTGARPTYGRTAARSERIGLPTDTEVRNRRTFGSSKNSRRVSASKSSMSRARATSGM